MSCWWCSCGENISENSRYDYNDTGNNVTEKHYGCYKVGIFFSLVIIFLLLLGCIPIFFLTENNNVILIVLAATLVLIGVVTYIYFRWQHKKALEMREHYALEKFTLKPLPSPHNNEHQHNQPFPPQNTTYQSNSLKIDTNCDIIEKSPPSQARYSFI